MWTQMMKRMMMRQAKHSGVTDAEVVAELQGKNYPVVGLNHQIVEDVWMDLKEAKGWRPRWNAVSGTLANGLPVARAARIIDKFKLYEEEG